MTPVIGSSVYFLLLLQSLLALGILIATTIIAVRLIAVAQERALVEVEPHIQTDVEVLVVRHCLHVRFVLLYRQLVFFLHQFLRHFRLKRL